MSRFDKQRLIKEQYPQEKGSDKGEDNINMRTRVCKKRQWCGWRDYGEQDITQDNGICEFTSNNCILEFFWEYSLSVFHTLYKFNLYKIFTSTCTFLLWGREQVSRSFVRVSHPRQNFWSISPRCSTILCLDYCIYKLTV